MLLTKNTVSIKPKNMPLQISTTYGQTSELQLENHSIN